MTNCVNNGKKMSIVKNPIRVLLLVLIVFISGISHVNAIEYNGEHEALTLDKKIGQLIMPGIPGTKADTSVAAMINKYHPGGILLYGRNTKERTQILSLTGDLQKLSRQAGDPPLIISIDQEGGRVKRITDAVTQFPGNMALGSADIPLFTNQIARITGIQLRLLGINMNLAPSVDVNTNPFNPIINIRAFGSSPEKVAIHSEAYIKGLQKARCLAVAKHFPGHGNTGKDSHKTLPVISCDYDTIRANDLLPFRRAIRADVSTVMSAHILFPALDENPATLSPRIMTSLLQEELSFKGIVMTDDLEMGAIAGNMNIGEAAVRSVIAGADIILISTHASRVGQIHSALKKAIESGRISMERLDHSVNKILSYKKQYRLDLSAEQYQRQLGNDDVKLLMNAQQINHAVSSSALYLHIDSTLTMKKIDNAKRVFVYSDTPLLRSLCRDAGITVYPRNAYPAHLQNVAREAADSCNRKVMPDQVITYYEIRDYDSLRLLPDARENLVLIVPDNAFLVSTRMKSHNALFSFSDTRASYTAIAAVLAGKFKPSQSIAIDLGFQQ